jgi:hypothetical protein
MSLRPKLKDDRMTVYGPGVAEPRTASGLRYRIEGPVANEPPEVTGRRDLMVTLRSLAWLPVVVLAVFAVRLLLVIPPVLLWAGAAILLAFHGLGLAADFLLGHALFRDPRRLRVPLVALFLVLESATNDPAIAIFVLLPVALGTASVTSHIIATQYAMWLAEGLDVTWGEREEFRLRWEEVRPLGPVALSAIMLALGVFFFAGRSLSPHLAGLVALGLVILFLAAQVTLCEAGPGAVVSACARGLVCWYSYNRHRWSGPQTFQFEPPWRDPSARSALVLGTTAILAAAVVGAALDAPVYDDSALARVLGRPSGPGRDDAEQEPAAAKPAVSPLDPEQELFLEQLPESEKGEYLASVRTARLQERRLSSGGTSLIDGAIAAIGQVMLLLPLPLLLLGLLLAAEFGPVLALYRERLEAPFEE